MRSSVLRGKKTSLPGNNQLSCMNYSDRSVSTIMVYFIYSTWVQLCPQNYIINKQNDINITSGRLWSSKFETSSLYIIYLQLEVNFLEGTYKDT